MPLAAVALVALIVIGAPSVATSASPSCRIGPRAAHIQRSPGQIVYDTRATAGQGHSFRVIGCRTANGLRTSLGTDRFTLDPPITIDSLGPRAPRGDRVAVLVEHYRPYGPADQNYQRVEVTDLASQQLVGCLSVSPAVPRRLALGPQGAIAYATSSGAHQRTTLRLADARGTRRLTTVASPRRLSAVKLGAAGLTWTANGTQRHASVSGAAALTTSCPGNEVRPVR